MKKLFQIGGVFNHLSEYEPDTLRIEYDFDGLKLGFISTGLPEIALNKFIEACKQAAQNGAMIDFNFDDAFKSRLEVIEQEGECFIGFDISYQKLADYGKYLVDEWKASHAE